MNRVDIVIPVHNEEQTLQQNVELLLDYLRTDFPFPIRVVIYRAHIIGGRLQVAADEASEAKFFMKADLPPLEEIAWPSAAHGLEAWRAYEPPRP